ncbi:MAG: hypothetical protein EXR71_12115 [Myxococcales bacterium]|nr:hypothetical protein [Myxococcales bacterium]
MAAVTEDDGGSSRLYAFAVEPGESANPRTRSRARGALEALAHARATRAGDDLPAEERRQRELAIERLEQLGYRE